MEIMCDASLLLFIYRNTDLANTWPGLSYFPTEKEMFCYIGQTIHSRYSGNILRRVIDLKNVIISATFENLRVTFLAWAYLSKCHIFRLKSLEKGAYFIWTFSNIAAEIMFFKSVALSMYLRYNYRTLLYVAKCFFLSWKVALASPFISQVCVSVYE